MAASAAAQRRSAGSRTTYERAELEALRDAPSKEAHARLWADVRATLVASGFSGEYDGLLVAEEDVRSRRGNRGMKAMSVRKWPEEAAAAARFLGTFLPVLVRSSPRDEPVYDYIILN
jgi:gem associated protein 2